MDPNNLSKQEKAVIAEDVRRMSVGVALVRMVKGVAGCLAREACILSGVSPDQADEWERAGIRCKYGEPVPDEAIARDGSTIFRIAQVLIEDKYIFASVMLVLTPPANTMHVRAIVGAKEWIDRLDPDRKLPVEWIIDPGEVDSTAKVY